MSAAIIALPIRVPDDITHAEAVARAIARRLALVIDRQGRVVMKPRAQPGDIVITKMHSHREAP